MTTCQASHIHHGASVLVMLSVLINPNLCIVYPSIKLDNPEDILSSIEKYKCDRLYSLPKLLNHLMDIQMVKKYNLSSLNSVFATGQPLMKNSILRLKNEWNIKYLYYSYGMSEIMHVCYSNIELDKNETFDDYEKCFKYNQLVPHFEFKIVNPETKEIEKLNVEGELHVRGFSVTKCYFDDDLKTTEAINHDRWYSNFLIS
jgi:acyl-coenzyme A synthetase/AMP-(fatty) acid ligase